MILQGLNSKYLVTQGYGVLVAPEFESPAAGCTAVVRRVFGAEAVPVFCSAARRVFGVEVNDGP